MIVLDGASRHQRTSPDLHTLIPNDSTSHSVQDTARGFKEEARESPHVYGAGRVILEGTPKHQEKLANQ